ncbi:hypothetical protein DWX57_09355 [Coprococcus sp. AF19-8AC]|uniref:cysteine-rich KTR domain-containing protein n=1 Tax=Coprococcus sp. AF19-8AC TaxID=2293090 RepID=UPI000E73C1FD|nr:cysteine-rich KTR domain-containing protein [Coprococcus sp. AF19-8AC]RJV45194.1 hypothetical protein DWX57_09355 [Coprococcus sp. AF19-8AC]
MKNSLWIYCPICGGKTKVYDDTILVKFPLYCPKCKKEIKIDVIQSNYNCSSVRFIFFPVHRLQIFPCLPVLFITKI